MREKLKSNIYLLLIYRLIILFVVYFICRLLFYALNTNLLGNISIDHLFTLFAAGLTFDISAIFYINIFYIAAQIIPLNVRYCFKYQKIFKMVFVVSNSIFLFFNCADLAFFQFSLRRTTLSVFGQFANDMDNFNLIFSLIVGYWWVLTIWLLLTCSLFFLYGPLNIKRPTDHFILREKLKEVALMCIVVFVVIVGMRGGLRDLPPININHATLKVKQPIESNIVLNTSFTLIRTVDQKSIRPYNFFSQQELEQIYVPIHHPAPTNKFSYKNIFIIILESFSKANIGYYTKQMDSTYIGYTPFLDSLISHSYGFKNSFANGFISIDAVPSILASIPSLVEGNYVSSVYANNRFAGLGTLLSEKGYDCSFYHGANNGSMRFLEFSRQAGYQHYYGRDEYNNEADYDGTWGIFDEPFLQFTANIVNTRPQPFLATLFTVTSHTPFPIPEKYKGVFPKGTSGIHESMGYSDYALRRFFETASKMAWFNNTLFVLVADHTSSITYEKFITGTGTLAIPIVFYDPSGQLPKIQNNERVIQQIDIMPSILDFLNYDKPYFAFGNSAFSTDNKDFALSYKNGVYQIIHRDHVLQRSEDRNIALYNYLTDPLLNNNLLEKGSIMPDSIDILLKAFIQQYNNRLINNQTILSYP